MFRRLIHPALIWLCQQQAHARCKKILAGIRSPRRKLLVLAGLMLGMVWLGQAILGILFRESADPEKLAIWIPLGLFAYSAWHFVKTIGSDPVEPFDWTPAETEQLLGAPITRTQLVTYRFVNLLASVLLKSACFSILMLPDLTIIPAGFVGMVLGLMLVEILRNLFEIVWYALSSQLRVVVRSLVYVGITAWIGAAIWNGFHQSSAAQDLSSPSGLVFVLKVLWALVDQLTTTGTWLLLPFSFVSHVILAETIDANLIGHLVLSIVTVVAGFVLVIAADRFAMKRRCRFESHALARELRRSSGSFDSSIEKSNRTIGRWAVTRFKKGAVPGFRVPIRLRGAGSIAWRQFLGAYHYKSTLAVSLGVPIFLCCLPLFASHGQFQMTLHIVAGLVFYSFLLLPPALMLDFRRDVNRLDVLKSLPISPAAVTMGQLAAPVALCAMFHWCVLGIAALAGSISWWQMVLAGVLLIPVCVLIFALENLIFMVSPYRRNQEGLDMFLRTILTFTAKGILFALGLAVTLVWALACRKIGSQFQEADWISGLLFGIGVWTVTTLASVVATKVLSNLYRNFDPSRDAPALS